MKKTICLLMTILICANLSGQQIQFIKYYGALCPDFGLSLDNTSDGGHILLGHTQDFGAQYLDMYLIKIDSSGNTEWQKLFGGINIDCGQSVQQTIDKGFILCGFTESFGAGGNDIYLVKTDSSGNLQWQRTFGGADDDYGYCVKQTKDKGFILCGSTASYGSGNTDAILIKTDSLGYQQWAKYYGGTNNDGSYSLDTLSEGGYVLAGYTYNFGAVIDNAMIVKTDSAGNQQWLKIFGGSGNDRALSIKKCQDNGYCFAGYTNSFGSGGYDMYLVRTDSSGNQVFYKTYGGTSTEKAFSIDLTPDKGFILTGQTNSYGAGNEDLYVVKTDTLGIMNWQNYFGGALNDDGFTIKTTKDKGYIAIGNTYSFNTTYSDVYVVKMDSTGYASNIQIYNGNLLNIIMYPNPATEKIIIECNTLTNDKMISIINLQGEVIFQKELQQAQTEVNIAGYAKGIYFVKVNTEHGYKTEKLIIQ